MKIAFFGIGKLGLPIAITLAQHHTVLAYDPQPDRLKQADILPEDGLRPMIRSANIRQVGMATKAVEDADIILVCVPTPHEPLYEGVTPIPAERKPFDYSYLERAAKTIGEIESDAPVVVISTVLPGATRQHVLPHIDPSRVVYSPSFCAMGTVVHDYLYPEGVLIGRDIVSEDAAALFLRMLHEAGVRPENQHLQMTIESAELAKVAYNTFISAKLGIVNALGLLCDSVRGADIDQVTDWLCMATRRVVSTSYMRAGMGDGGACHPRDNIAMSWLARETGQEWDVFDAIMQGREAHARHLAVHLSTLSREGNLPVCVHGINYKPGTPLQDGSHGRLVVHFLLEHLPTVPWANGSPVQSTSTCVSLEAFQAAIDATPSHIALVGQNEAWMPEVNWKPGSVVIDPWRIVPDQDGVEVIRVGAAARGRVI